MEELEKIAAALRSGGAMLYPTDTLWGLGCDATNEAAVAKIFAIKQRADAKSLIVLVDGEEMLSRYVPQIPDLAWDIVRLSNVPQTIIYPAGIGFARNVCAPDGSVAIRIAEHDFCKKIIRKLGKPIVSTSANISGSEAPRTFSEISEAIKKVVDIQVSATFEGQPTRQPSSIIKINLNGGVQVIR
ncbi:MAG: threonylcarbamoyl-AMP synthase [Prevotellaceae bacterium]|jgi:L-threonylcarbamoyladenylate synthase|nr:threonylcarbamoyl-AMP synthase [Prevotellaceae bacterium]